MSHLLARIMLALLMLPLGTVIYVVSAVALVEWVFNYGTEKGVFLLAGFTSSVFIAVYWVLLWRGTVQWTPRRLVWTIGAGVIAVVAGVGVGAVAYTVDDDFGVFLGTVTAPLVWLMLSVFVWRETAAERQSRIRTWGGTAVVCPRCGYNLTGLTQATCPECGAAFTLEELVRSQPAAESAEIQGGSA